MLLKNGKNLHEEGKNTTIVQDIIHETKVAHKQHHVSGTEVIWSC